MSGLRYFYVGFFLLILATIIVGGYLSRSYIEQRIIRTIAQDTSQHLLENFSTIIWQPHRRVLNRLPCASASCPDSSNAKQDFFDYFSQSKLLYARMYRSDGKHESLFDNKNFTDYHPDDSAQKAFDFAVSGKMSSTVAHDVFYQGGIYNIVRTLYPVLVYADENRSAVRVPAVLEIGYDISPFWNNIALWQWAIVGGVSLLFGALMLTMIISTWRTERIMARQFEKNTELVAAKADAEAENKSKSQFLANISHELRTPLNAIIGFSQIIKDEVMGPINNAEYKQYVKDIYVSGEHLLALINDILDFSKAEADKLTVNSEDVDMKKLISNSIRLVTPRAEEAGVALEAHVPDERHILTTDPKRLKQVILNVLSNSVKFTETGGKITVHTWHGVEDNSFYIEMTDTGVGIAPKDIPKVMAVFGQTENKLSRRYEGTGLGLPLSKKLVELMGGEFIMTSELNVGTKVTIRLPYLRTETTATSPDSTVTTPATNEDF